MHEREGWPGVAASSADNAEKLQSGVERMWPSQRAGCVLQRIRYARLRQTLKQVLDGLVVMIRLSHSRERGSIPRRGTTKGRFGAFSFFCFRARASHLLPGFAALSGPSATLRERADEPR